MRKIDLISKIVNRCGEDIELSDVEEWFDNGCSTFKCAGRYPTSSFTSYTTTTASHDNLKWKISKPEQKIVHRISIETDKLVLYESGSHYSKIAALPYGDLDRYCIDEWESKELFNGYKLGSGIEVCHSEAISGSTSNVHRLPNLLTALVHLGYKIDEIPSANSHFKFIHMTKPVL